MGITMNWISRAKKLSKSAQLTEREKKRAFFQNLKSKPKPEAKKIEAEHSDEGKKSGDVQFLKQLGKMSQRRESKESFRDNFQLSEFTSIESVVDETSDVNEDYENNTLEIESPSLVETLPISGEISDPRTVEAKRVLFR